MISIINKTDCCGCEACIQKCPKQCISLKEDHEGFLYPVADEEVCIDCGICEKVCPVINQGVKRTPLAVYAAKNKNEEVRMKSSSGGIFSLLAEQTLMENGVVFGARFNEDWEVIHDHTEKAEELDAFRRSKYVQSRIGNTYKEAEQFLKQGRKVLFVGTPCQIRGLKLFLRKEYENLLAVDFVCHGVPSPKVWKKYLYELSNGGKISDIQFRNKKTGWNNYSLTIQSTQKVLLDEKASNNIYMKGFLSDLYLRPSCYQCPAKQGKSGSDITIADYWNIRHVLPEFDDDKGAGLVLINTQKGEKHYSLHKTESIETNYEEAQGCNSGFKENIKVPQNRALFFQKLGTENISLLISKTLRPSLKNKVKNKIKTILRKFK